MHHITRQAGPTQGWTPCCPDTHGPGQTVGLGALDRTIPTQQLRDSRKTAGRKSQALALKETYMVSRVLGNKRWGGRCTYLPICTEQREDAGGGDVFIFLLVCVSYFSGLL